LIFEVTEGRILPLPINNQQSTINNRQFFTPTGKYNPIPMGFIGFIIPAPCKNPPWRLRVQDKKVIPGMNESVIGTQGGAERVRPCG
jgi:hypothetical protein